MTSAVLRVCLLGSLIAVFASCGEGVDDPSIELADGAAESPEKNPSRPPPPPPPPAGVDVARELLITDVNVVEDPARTVYVAGVRSGPRGAWSFGRLMEDLAGRRGVSAFTLDWLTQWERNQNINGYLAPARPNIRTILIDPWLVASGCSAGATVCNLDFTRAPFRLTAIVNRMDKRDDPNAFGRVAHAGEGRFVFVALGATGNPLNFTVIFEYELRANTQAGVLSWARDWHRLGSFPFGNAYNNHLQFLTDRFALSVPGQGKGGPILHALRTNEVSAATTGSDPTNTPSTKLWEIRSFVLDRSTGLLRQDTVAQTPVLGLSGSSTLGTWLNANAAAVLNDTYSLPTAWLDAASPTPSVFSWTAPGVSNPAVLSAFALNTCSGCHRSETTTAFVHIGKRLPGERAVVSAWMTNVELPRRAQDFLDLVGGRARPGRGKGRGH